MTVNGVPQPGIARTLKAVYESFYKGPQDGIPAASEFQDLARRTGGVFALESVSPTPPDVVK